MKENNQNHHHDNNQCRDKVPCLLSWLPLCLCFKRSHHAAARGGAIDHHVTDVIDHHGIDHHLVRMLLIIMITMMLNIQIIMLRPDNDHNDDH